MASRYAVLFPPFTKPLDTPTINPQILQPKQKNCCKKSTFELYINARNISHPKMLHRLDSLRFYLSEMLRSAEGSIADLLERKSAAFSGIERPHHKAKEIIKIPDDTINPHPATIPSQATHRHPTTLYLSMPVQ